MSENNDNLGSAFLARLAEVRAMISDQGLATLEASHFLPELGKHFGLDLGSGQPLELVLADVMERTFPYDVPGRKPFTLFFHGTCNRALAQGTYRLRSEKLKELDVFLVPIGPDASGAMRYQAVFS